MARKRGGIVDRRRILAGTGMAGAAGAAALAGCGAAQPGLAGPGGAPRVANMLGTAGVAGAAAGAAGQIVRVTVEVNKQALVELLHQYLSDPKADRSRHPVVEVFSSPQRLGLPAQLLEAIRLEGEPSREEVETFVTGLLSGYENLVVH